MAYTTSTSSEGGVPESYEIFKAEGGVLFKQGEFKKAIQSYNTALDLQPGDVNCLISRSKCYLELQDLTKALEDSDAVLKEEKNHIKGLLQKAEVLYFQGDFEKSLVFYHRGNKLRPEIKEFRLGIQKTQEAINNSVGDEAGLKLNSGGDLTFFFEGQSQSEAESEDDLDIDPDPDQSPLSVFSAMAKQRSLVEPTTLGRTTFSFSQKEDDAEFDALVSAFMQQYLTREKQGKKKGGYNKPGSRREDRRDKQRPKSCHQNSKTVKELLGELYDDKVFLEELLHDVENSGAKTDTNKAIRDLSIEGLDYLTTRTAFWQQQKPMYSRKRDKQMREGTQSRASSAGSKKDRTKWVLKKLEEIDEIQADGDFDKSLKMSQRVLKDVERWNDDELPNRPEVVANLHSCIGNAYLELGKYDLAIKHHKKDLEIADQKDLEDAKSRAMDNLGRVHARRGDYEKAVKVWEEKLPLAKSALEKTWLFHEIGRCYLEKGEHETAKDYGEKSLMAAQEAGDDVWQLNASVLIAQSQVKLGDLQEALDSFEKSLEMAKLQNDKMAQNAIKQALDDVNSKIVRGIKDSDDQEEQTSRASSRASGRASSRASQKSEGRKKSPSPKGSVHSSPRDSPKQTTQTQETSQEKESQEKETTQEVKEETSQEKEKSQEEEKRQKVTYHITTKTADKMFAGTDSDVFITIYGDKGDTGRIELRSAANDFESGKTDEYDHDLPDAGKLEKVHIGHNGENPGAGWYLDELIVEVRSRNEKVVFPNGRWLDKEEDDGAIEIDLFPSTDESQTRK